MDIKYNSKDFLLGYYNGKKINKAYKSGQVIYERIGKDEPYIRLEYIENTSSAYINLGITPYSSTTNSYEVYAKMQSSPRGREFENLFACEKTNSAPYTGFIARWSTHETGLHVSITPDNGTTSVTDNGDGTSGITITVPQTEATASTPTTIFCGVYGSTQSSPTRNSTGKLYSFTLTVNENVVVNLIPVKRNSDGKIGALNTVDNTFYTSPNNVEFIAGPKVS